MSDEINPSYYVRSGFDLNDAIIDWGLAFNPGCTVKYICRAGHKGDFLTDIRKALKHMEMWWDAIGKSKSKAPTVIDSEISPALVVRLWKINDMRLVGCISNLSDIMRAHARAGATLQVIRLLREVLDDPKYQTPSD